jgi:thiamine-monophosphate kinase
MSEFDRIARLARRFGKPPAPAIGIGDDCAVLPPGRFASALKVDASIEGVHFTRALLSLDQAAERAVEAAMSDIAAAGGTMAYAAPGGCGLLCALTVPRTLGEDEFDALIEGVARAAERAGAVVLGGNLTSAPVVTITITAIGRVEGRALTRSGARPGDRLCVTGVVGAAALGLRALHAGRGDDPEFAPFVRAWRAPRARLQEGPAMARFASASVDLSDGLTLDAGHLASASGCGVVIDLDALPMLEGQREAAARLGLDATELALGGGEDYEICFAAPTLEPPPVGSAGWRVIGEVIAGSGVHVRDARGVRPYVARGWDHFTS